MYNIMVFAFANLTMVGCVEASHVTDVGTIGVYHTIHWIMTVIFGIITAVISVIYRRQRLKLKRLTELSLTDDLTKLNNRRSIFARATEEMARAERKGEPLTVAVCDIDFFKRINDTHGHDVGDEVLCEVANVFTSNVRTEDFVGRLGGEEFAILLPNTTNDQATVLIERLLTNMRESVMCGGISVTISAGLSTNRPNEDFIAMLKRADNALYRAKDGGRDRIVGCGCDDKLNCCTHVVPA